MYRLPSISEQFKIFFLVKKHPSGIWPSVLWSYKKSPGLEDWVHPLQHPPRPEIQRHTGTIHSPIWLSWRHVELPVSFLRGKILDSTSTCEWDGLPCWKRFMILHFFSNVFSLQTAVNSSDLSQPSARTTETQHENPSAGGRGGNLLLDEPSLFLMDDLAAHFYHDYWKR